MSGGSATSERVHNALTKLFEQQTLEVIHVPKYNKENH